MIDSIFCEQLRKGKEETEGDAAGAEVQVLIKEN